MRASNLSNQGFFSLFNPEIIEKQYVYASNPPLTYGNSSAGIVEIETKRNLETNQLSVSAGLLGVGILLNQKIIPDKSFIQIYGNLQKSTLLINLQKKSFPDLQDFSTQDLGWNYNSKIGKKSVFNSYNYFIKENFNGFDENYSYRGSFNSNRKRFITINTLNYYTKVGVINFANSVSIDNNNAIFGNINSKTNFRNIYSSVNYKWNLLDNTSVQFGVNHDYRHHFFRDSVPKFFYASSPSSPSVYSEKDIKTNIIEAYIFTNWIINDKLNFSSGMRKNIAIENQADYLSSQLSLKCDFKENNALLLSFGKYFNYSTPNFYSKSYNLLQSNQLALDYTFNPKKVLLKSAIYYKNEIGQQNNYPFFTIDKINSFGIEFYIEQNLSKYFKYTLSNTFINQDLFIDGKKYHGEKDYNYLVNLSLQYLNPKFVNLSIMFNRRPGDYYNTILESKYNSELRVYEPIFDEKLNNQQYNSYTRIDFTANKFISLGNKGSLVVFCSINNFFNMNNEKVVQYNSDFSKKHFQYYQKRNFYLGGIWSFN